MLKLAVIRVHDEHVATAGQIDILFEAPLKERIHQEVHSRTLFGFRKRAARKAVAAVEAIENQLRDEILKV